MGVAERERAGARERVAIIMYRIISRSIYIRTQHMKTYQGRMVVSHYVGMPRKQDDDSNECISNYTVITQLHVGANCTCTHF